MSHIHIYGLEQNNSVSFVGKVDVKNMKYEKIISNFIKRFLPKNYTSFLIDKNMTRNIHIFKNLAAIHVSRNTPSVSEISAFPQVVAKFTGLNQTQCDCAPPDVQIAVGPNQVVEMVNAEMKIWSKKSGSVSEIPLNKFYMVSTSDVLSDPRIFFDQSSKRWFTSILDTTVPDTRIAVSSSDDPTNTWTIFDVKFDGNCPDQPSIGISDNNFVISANDFSNCVSNPTFVGAQYYVIDKNDLLNGISPKMEKFGPDSSAFSIVPSQSLGPTNTLFMASTYGNDNVVHLYSLNGTVPNIQVMTKDLVIQTLSMPPSALQLGTKTLLETNDDRIQSSVWSDGNLWIALNDGCTPLGDTETRSCIRIIDIDTSLQKINQDFDAGTINHYYFYPALTVDSEKRLDLIFGYSSSNDYPGLVFTGQTSTEKNTLEPSQIFQTGMWYDSTGRYGDYFGAATDPENTTYAWVSGEFHSDHSSAWNTEIASTNPITIPEFSLSVQILLVSMLSIIIFYRLPLKMNKRI